MQQREKKLLNAEGELSLIENILRDIINSDWIYLGETKSEEEEE